MLNLILGPSGSGKTTIIDGLVQAKKWVPILSYITRPARVGDKFKKSMSQLAYDELLNAEAFWSHVSQFGHSYGILKSDIEEALCDQKTQYVIDFSFKTREQFFGHVQHVAIALIPESDEELGRRLTIDGRPERLEQALKDMKDVSRLALSEQIGSPVLVVNARDQQDATIAKIISASSRT